MVNHTRRASRGTVRWLALVLGALALTLTACGGDDSSSSSTSGAAATSTTASTGASTTASGGSAATPDEEFAPGDWAIFGRDWDNTRYAPQDSINKESISRLGEAWHSDLGGNQWLNEAFPIVVDGVVYITTSTNEIYAFEGDTGRVKWKYAPKVDFSLSSGVGGYGIVVNRGVAVSDGKVYMLTFDCRLKAVSAATGEEIFSTQVEDPRSGAYETMSPAVYNGLVYVGSSGSDQGVAGFVAAYDGDTGREKWRFDTIPPVGEGWRRRGTGGGTVYMAPQIDTENGNVIFGTANPSPAIVGVDRPGDNLYTSSIVALDAMSGEYRWHHQVVAHDLWDYDAASPVVIFDAIIDGERRRMVAEAGKSGWLVFLDARTGEQIHPRLSFVRQQRSRPTERPTLQCPGPLGGSQYSPMAYSPRVEAVYVSGIDFCFLLAVSDEKLPGESRFGGTRSFPSDSRPSGSFSAVDVRTGRFIWRQRMSTPMGGGALVTGSDIVYTVDQLGYLYAFDAATGRELWKGNLGLAGAAAPVLYTIDGVDYIGAAVGGSGLTSSNDFGPIGARFYALKLDGREIIPPRAPRNPSTD
ncbi:PQQ-binding-like beta-propeller repeat protein [Conexibacter stalactiti]|uniref:PQQ-binding-like beta-propeller repeat protein n=1 Tax=Conexibacter stalactiti TaxID=1940611 RepID=A0ABU4HYA5_9ACTN|nr:PQQ-binding-like beta-propeller repeat protein [Conexibacter stalactiti]MDW5597455.1 PQQ-binding-like beta-propeller repeat protein [Conexibacter stalactiti]MEC5038097.1 PQQ-binding-like beta-propeller repeat protein [Conexibacter stalactiti]